jgi:hypothetical protein
MKKFIYTFVFVLLAGFQFVQAQEVNFIGLYTINGGTIYSQTLEGYTITDTLSDGITGLIFPVVVQFQNKQFDSITQANVFISKVSCNGQSLENDTSLVRSHSTVMKDSMGFILSEVTIPISLFKPGLNANNLCFEVTAVVNMANMTIQNVTTTPFCVNFTTDITVGITDIDHLKEVSIFPNPIRDNNLKIENLNEATDIHIYNITGQLIRTEAAVMGNANIDVSNLSNGMYILKLQSGKSTRTEKIQVIR